MTAVPARLLAGLAGVLLVAGCSADGAGSDVDPEQVDAVEAPELGACRDLTPEDVALPTNATRTVPCSEPHTAQTYAVGDLPAELQDAEYDDPALGGFAYRTCSNRFQKFVGGDESLVMRAVVSWAWFRPSEEAWSNGARWYRCDIVGGGEHNTSYVELPTVTRGLLQGDVGDEWLVCARGRSVARAARVPCSEPHTWRAVSTIKLGEPDDPYPGDRLVQVRSRDFCDSSVGAVLGYPVSYDFAYTWFHEAEWEVGNRRSICWARTDE